MDCLSIYRKGRIKIESLNLNQKIGQLFITEVDGTNITGEMINLLKQHHIGGICLQQNNAKKPQQVYQLTSNLQSYKSANLPLFIAAKHMNQKNCMLTKGVSLIPSQKELGEINNRLYTKQAAEIIGKELYNLGINMNLSPSLELSEEKDTSFSNQIRLVAQHGRAMIEGLHKQQVIAAAGVFPDPVKIISAHTPLYKTELEPFIYAVKHGLQVIITDSTAAVPVLRNQLAFDGLIILSFESEPALEQVIHAINIGADVMLLEHDHRSVIRIISRVTAAVKTGKIDIDKIDEAVRRIITLKKQFIDEHDEFYNEKAFQTKKHLNFIKKLEGML